ncbi:MAG: cyclic nucleotide-binding domain-containing protein, partial [Nitrospirota bacterium]
MDEFDILKTVPLLAFLTDQELREIKPLLIEQLYEKGTFIFREGEKAEWFYFLKSGAVKCLKFTPEGKELILRILLPGEIFCCEAVTF